MPGLWRAAPQGERADQKPRGKGLGLSFEDLPPLVIQKGNLVLQGKQRKSSMRGRKARMANGVEFC